MKFPALSWPVVVAYAATIGAAAFLVHTDKLDGATVFALLVAFVSPSPALRTGGEK